MRNLQLKTDALPSESVSGKLNKKNKKDKILKTMIEIFSYIRESN